MTRAGSTLKWILRNPLFLGWEGEERVGPSAQEEFFRHMNDARKIKRFDFWFRIDFLIDISRWRTELWALKVAVITYIYRFLSGNTERDKRFSILASLSLFYFYIAYPRVRSFIEMRLRLFLPVVRQMGRVTTSIPDVFLRRDVFNRDFDTIPAVFSREGPQIMNFRDSSDAA